MKVGDIVNFASEFFHHYGRHVPGLIIDVDDTHRQMVYVVYWGDGKITKEHPGLLELWKEDIEHG